jgi:hypothetical protein
VGSITELDQLCTLILSKPIYMMAKCKVQVGEHYQWNTRIRQFVATDFVVRLETGCEDVREQLMQLFSEAHDHFTKGRKFCIKINLNQVIQSWFQRSAARRVYAGTSSCYNAVFSFHNSSEPCCNGVCSCNEDPCVCVCTTICCLPIALFTCIPYCIYRKCRFSDKTHYLTGEVKIGINVEISAGDLLDILARCERQRMTEEHERLYGPLGAQPPPYSPAPQDPPRADAQHLGLRPTRQPYAHRPPNPSAFHIQTPTVEQPPPYTETVDDETMPILQHPS